MKPYNWGIKLFLSIALCLVLGLPLLTHATDTIRVQDTLILIDTVPGFTVPVTYYDFHQDGSNPEFEMKKWRACEGGCGLVLDTLDEEGKPIFNPAMRDSGYLVENVARWYREWKPGDSVMVIHPPETLTYIDSTAVPETIVTFFGTVLRYPQKRVIKPADTVVSDTFFKNVVIPDSFTFWKYDYLKISSRIDPVTSKLIFDTVVYPNVYQVDNMRNTFFPIDRRGFDSEYDPAETLLVKKHNFSFTMEMKNKFVYKGGEVLRVMGDDDIWVFINRRLAIDLGGLHATQAKEIFLDSLASKLQIAVGDTYDFALFFAERHTTGSNLSIVTNIEFIIKNESNKVLERRIVPIASGGLKGKSNIKFFRKAIVEIGSYRKVLFVPEMTNRITVDVFNASGKKVSRNTKKIGEPFALKKPVVGPGTYFIQVKCLNNKNGIIESFVDKFTIVP